MRIRRAGSRPRRLPGDRAAPVEAQLRERADQLKPRRTPLGVCHACSTIVYKGDSLAIAGGQLFHGDCPPRAQGPNEQSAA